MNERKGSLGSQNREISGDFGSGARQKNFRSHFIVDIDSRGVRFSACPIADDERDPRISRRLRFGEDCLPATNRSRLSSRSNDGLTLLNEKLQQLSRRGILRQSIITLGVMSDPFYPFEGKFDMSMKFLELFQRYTPALFQLQTRSPLAVIAMPVLKKFGEQCVVSIGIETHREDLARRYTPELPRVEERMKMARALRNFGVPVQVQVGPVLPYGDWKRDATEFAEKLSQCADYICVSPLSDGTKESERFIRHARAVKMIAEERAFHYLRPDAHIPLQLALERIAPEKLALPRVWRVEKRQLEIFAA